MKNKARLAFNIYDIICVAVLAVAAVIATLVLSGPLKMNKGLAASLVLIFFVAIVTVFVFFKFTVRYKRGIRPQAEVRGIIIDSATASHSPVVITNADGIIVWMNSAAARVSESGQPSTFEELFLEGQDGIYTSPDKNAFYMCETHTAHGTDDNEYTVRTLCDVTERIENEKVLLSRDTVIAYITVDNLDELINYEQEDYRAASADCDKILRAWANEAGGTLKEYQQDKYMFIFEKKYLPVFTEKGFDVLDKIRSIRLGENSIPVTVSIGASAMGATLQEKEKNAKSALDMALQRGGDQAVVKGEGTLEIFGGKTKGAQKKTSVRARVIANELVSHISSSDNVIIMFHRFGDFDAIGSAVGLARLCMFCGVDVNIVCDENDTGIRKCKEWIMAEKDYRGVFIDAGSALDRITSGTLLIICDVSNPRQFECPALAENCRNIVIVDHHRKTVEFEREPIISYIEPSASAASELVSEMLEQVLPQECLLPREADLMMAGILLDTNQFTKSTGTRTFSAALYLRSMGADVGDVQEFFKTDLKDYQRELRFNTNVEIYRDVAAIAIAQGDCTVEDKIPAAKAANRLLTVEGVKASFAIVPIGDEVHISARSSGTINVQLILEELRGGGHYDAAGTRIEGTTVLDAEKMLKAAIDKYLIGENQNKN